MTDHYINVGVLSRPVANDAETITGSDAAMGRHEEPEDDDSGVWDMLDRW